MLLIIPPVCIIAFIFLSPKETKVVSEVYNTFYVSINGSDGDNGTKSAPFRTIQHAVDMSTPGTTIYVMAGTYYELVNIHEFGELTSAPLTISAFNDEHVIIDGSKRDETESESVAFYISNSFNVVIRGFEIQNITTHDDDVDPAGILIRGHSENITIEHNNIHHIANYHKEGNAHGLLVYGNDKHPIKNIKIHHNKLHHLTLGSSESLTFSGNITDFTIEHNYLYNNSNIGIDIAGHYNACESLGCTDIARNGVVSYNTVLQNSSSMNPSYEGDGSAAGIYVDGGQDIVISHNIVGLNNFGISISSENNGKDAKNITVENNVIFQNEKAGLILGGSSLENGGTYEVVVSDNTFINNDTIRDGYFEITVQQHNKRISLTNNRYFTSNESQYLNDASKMETTIIFNNEQIFDSSLFIK